jgi:hypothetical protein
MILNWKCISVFIILIFREEEDDRTLFCVINTHFIISEEGANGRQYGSSWKKIEEFDLYYTNKFVLIKIVYDEY